MSETRTSEASFGALDGVPERLVINRFPRDLHRRLIHLRNATGLTQTRIVAEALAEFLDEKGRRKLVAEYLEKESERAKSRA